MNAASQLGTWVRLTIRPWDTRIELTWTDLLFFSCLNCHTDILQFANNCCWVAGRHPWRPQMLPEASPSPLGDLPSRPHPQFMLATWPSAGSHRFCSYATTPHRIDAARSFMPQTHSQIHQTQGKIVKYKIRTSPLEISVILHTTVWDILLSSILLKQELKPIVSCSIGLDQVHCCQERRSRSAHARIRVFDSIPAHNGRKASLLPLLLTGRDSRAGTYHVHVPIQITIPWSATRTSTCIRLPPTIHYTAAHSTSLTVYLFLMPAATQSHGSNN
jgi:hypothetical protein